MNVKMHFTIASKQPIFIIFICLAGSVISRFYCVSIFHSIVYLFHVINGSFMFEVPVTSYRDIL